MDIGRVLKSIEKDSKGCWIWQRSCNSAGYGQLTVNKKNWLAHRYAYACFNVLKDEELVRHACHNKKCCNPEHLSKGNHLDNWRDSVDTHRKVHRDSGKGWVVKGTRYTSIRFAKKSTGLTIATLHKFTDPVSRVFDVEAYREGCRRAAWIPKI